jgi:type I restriction enzyme, S subunit
MNNIVIPHKRYKASGRRWLGDVPEHWDVKRIRFVADVNPSKSEVSALSRDIEVSFIPMEAVGEDGSLVLDRVRPIGEVETGYTYFRDGDVTFAKITPCFENGKGAIMRGLVGGIGFGTTELTVARPKHSKATAEYLYWLFTSVHFRKLGEGAMYGAGGQKRVPEDFLRDFVWAFPSVAEQAAIAYFLDRETAKIDALVEQQQRLIESLKEKQQGRHLQCSDQGPRTERADERLRHRMARCRARALENRGTQAFSIATDHRRAARISHQAR